MPKGQIDVFDTTLRDGTQGEKIAFSVDGKLQIAGRLDDIGVHYIEGGWPGSNPKDIEFFSRAKKVHFKNAKIVAFGSTRYKGNSVENDPNLNALLNAETPAVSIFGKSWLLHVEKALNILPDENLSMIRESVAYLKSRSKEVIYDAEHFFDGYKHDPYYALKTITAAGEAGADVIVLCDTNGGSLPREIADIVSLVGRKISTKLGIHTHNDSELAVANTLTAVENGAEHVQGTINGYGERCGNANLCSIIPDLQLKMDYRCIPDDKLSCIHELSRYVSETANMIHQNNFPFVGNSAFAHKGGIHVSAVIKDCQTYEHIPPERVGNKRRVLVSELSGKSNLLYKSSEIGIDLEKHTEKIPEIVQKLKILEHKGYSFESADGSLEVLINRLLGKWKDYFELSGFRILMEKDRTTAPRSEATIRLTVDGVTEHIAAEGRGPVHALDNALRKALINFYPDIEDMGLSDYKVRVIDEKEGTAAKVRVLIDFKAHGHSWGTVSVSENIIEASWQALLDGYIYYFHKNGKTQRQFINREKEAAEA
ncbi:MAG: citramalate synthase [bacterium]|nr:citramalate synthase [bacterium]